VTGRRPGRGLTGKRLWRARGAAREGLDWKSGAREEPQWWSTQGRGAALLRPAMEKIGT
jgi:hypothetical protein